MVLKENDERSIYFQGINFVIKGIKTAFNYWFQMIDIYVRKKFDGKR